ncbi:hypothetical protein CC86DRAFT_70838 [Ophiobolus disseminans]|uniref:Uncharacterized protein n=1 Tax=Ophiobolus disseminans TaxID=1469910 RepID=A0A6A6ZNT8_9PLEO|nr:hypothetical protein CC86DRAFT_70838 [Ophiobolus disseminans]
MCFRVLLCFPCWPALEPKIADSSMNSASLAWLVCWNLERSSLNLSPMPTLLVSAQDNMITGLKFMGSSSKPLSHSCCRDREEGKNRMQQKCERRTVLGSVLQVGTPV